jgi:tetratricopeptide (TPR) repeat protein
MGTFGAIARGARRAARIGAIMVALLLGMAALAPSAIAQAQDRAALLAKKQALFQQMLSEPSNLDVAFAYANIAAQLGDDEAAVSTLERMLLFNPNLPRVQLELGALYFRMGSFDLARSYFDQAKAANPPPEVRVRVDEYIDKIGSLDSPSQFSGYVFTGVQYQSDANVAPGSPLIHSPIGDVLLNSEFVKARDFDIFATGAIYYSYDLGTQDRDTFEVSALGYANHYFQFNRLDLDLAESTAGVRLRYPNLNLPQVDALSLKPYMILNYVALGENPYFNTYGAGGEAAATLFGDIATRLIFEFRQKNFSNAPDRPVSRGLNGNDKLVSLQTTKPVTDNSALTLQFDYLDQQTRLDFYANQSYGLAAGYRIRYDDPTGNLPFPWETTVFGSRTLSFYEGVDPCCNTSGSSTTFSGSPRYDRRWRFGLTHTVQFARNAALIIQFQRDIVSSNLPIYAYTSNSVLIGPQLRF